MKTLHDLKAKVVEYQRDYRAPALPLLETSGLYDLFPDVQPHADIQVENVWPKAWPHCTRQGIYAICDDELYLLYVGKASMTNTIGCRLSNYFAYGEGKKCRVIHDSWSRKPRFVVTVAVPQRLSFEAPALEEFLIGELKPPDNAMGIIRG